MGGPNSGRRANPARPKQVQVCALRAYPADAERIRAAAVAARLPLGVYVRECALRGLAALPAPPADTDAGKGGER